MKLATLPSTTSRDGELIIVSRDLTRAVSAKLIVSSMQAALDNWQHYQPKLEQLSKSLNDGKASDTFTFDETKVLSPLPRAYQWADGSAYVKHVELVRKARGAELPASFWVDPLMYQGGSDIFLTPHQDIPVADVEWGVDFEAEVAVITADVPMGVTAEQAKDKILLLMLVNDVSLRNLIPNELAKGFGFFQSKPSSSFSPVAVTPDELGEAWDGQRLNLSIVSHLNSHLFGQPNAAKDMTFDFPMLIAHAAKTRFLIAGSIIGSGTVSNLDPNTGSSCIAEKRMLETIEFGAPRTSFMKYGDRIRIEMFDKNQKSIFGAIDQKVVEYKK